MTVAGLEEHAAWLSRVGTAARDDGTPAGVSAEGMDFLRRRVERAVTMTETAHDRQLSEALTLAVEAFLEAGGDPHAAAARVAPWFERIGARQAHVGESVPQLAQQFQRARQATQRGLRDALGDVDPGISLVRVRESLMTYLELLFRQSRRGMEDQRRMPPPDEDKLAAVLFDRGDSTMLSELAAHPAFAGQTFTPIVAVSGLLPLTVLRHRSTRHRVGGSEAVVPHDVDVSALLEGASEQVVAGAPVALADLPEALRLARRGAALILEGRIDDERMIVPCSDLLGDLLVTSNAVLADLLMRKHLSALEEMPASRRLKLAETLLTWLESGLPINQLARERGLAQQTIHSRLKSARALFGDALDDPTQRLELVVALRAALPRWRDDA